MMPMVNKYSMVMEKILCTVQIYLFILILSLLKLKFYFKKKRKKTRLSLEWALQPQTVSTNSTEQRIWL